MRANDDVALLAGRAVEHRGQGAGKVGKLHAAPKAVLSRRRASSMSRQIAWLRQMAKASSIARASLCPMLAPSSAMPPPVFHFFVGRYYGR